MKTFKIFLSLLVLAAVIYSCKRDQQKPVENDKVNPGKVANVKAVSRPGTVKLTYTLPTDPDLLYVLAEYTDKYGKVIQNKASYYSDSLVIQGFADSAVHQMSIYAVDRSENKSEPVVMSVKAMSPPVFGVKTSLVLTEDFGGINISYANPNEADIAIIVAYKDSLGYFVTNETIYTKLKQGSFTSRSFKPKPTVFGVYVRDRWNNRTDTVFKTLTPIFEKELDKSKFRTLALPGDVKDYGNGLVVSNLWDKIISPDANMWHSDGNAGMPMHINFDLGVTAKLSRFVLWQRSGQYIYNHGNPKRYEIWGSTNPAVDGSFTNWVLLKSCISVKPSGQATGVNSQADVDAAARGEEWNVPLSAAKVRYIRVVVLENWTGGPQAHIAEMSFFGNDN